MVEFYLEVVNKYSAYGNIYAEGKINHGQLNIGDTVFVYDKNGRSKFNKNTVSALNNAQGIQVQNVKGDGQYCAIALNGVQNVGDFEKDDIVSGKELTFESPVHDEPPIDVKSLPKAKTYNDADRRTHINMATNDIASMSASGSLASNRDWIRNVGQDLYDVHGFDAMQEVFINVKTRYPNVQSQLSSVWDGVGGWAD